MKEKSGEVKTQDKTSIMQAFEEIGKDQYGLEYLKKNIKKINLNEAADLLPAVKEIKPINKETEAVANEVLRLLTEKIQREKTEIENQKKVGRVREAIAREKLGQLESLVEINKEDPKVAEMRRQAEMERRRSDPEATQYFTPEQAAKMVSDAEKQSNPPPAKKTFLQRIQFWKK
jgi:hypothetical protein